MEAVTDVVLIVILLFVCALGMLLAVLQLPGTWLIVAGATGYALYYDWQRIGMYAVIAGAVVAVLAEAGETLSGLVAAKRAGASRRAAWYGLFGGLAGALLLTVPVPLVGTIVGAVIGCFVGAFLAEMQEGRSLQAGARSGTYSAIGRALGSVLKILAALIISGVTLVTAIASFWG